MNNHVNQRQSFAEVATTNHRPAIGLRLANRWGMEWTPNMVHARPRFWKFVRAGSFHQSVAA
jgi:hypothetical protein